MSFVCKTKRCLRCSKEAQQSFLPFCSERCRLVDLHNWLSGRYAIHTDETPDADLEAYDHR